MLRNFIKIAWRTLLKNKKISLINLAGLSFSVAFCLLLLFFIRREQSFDSFHAKKDRLYRFEMSDLFSMPDTISKKGLFSFLTQKEDEDNQITIPLIVGRDLQQGFPEVKSCTRFLTSDNELVKVGNVVYKESNVIYTDSNFFENFSFPLVTGKSSDALNGQKNVVISESLASKYFGTENPVGKIITLINDSVRSFSVSGVAKDAPANSSIQFGIVLPLTADLSYESNIRERFNHSSHFLILELQEGSSVRNFENKINLWKNSYFTEYLNYFKGANINQLHWFLRPLADSHYNKSSGWGHYTSLKNIYQLSCLALVILIIASINYVLLVISGAAARSSEMCVRKIMGAGRKSIILQFWVETQILVAISVLTGLVLSRVLLPFFNQSMQSDISMHDFSFMEVAGYSLAVSLILGVMAGYYPAVLLSKMKLVTVIKGFKTYKINPRFSTMLVVLQFTSCVVLTMAVFVINRQMNFIRDRDLGFNKDQILIVKNPTWEADFTKMVTNRLEDFAPTQPYILGFSAMNGGLNGNGNNNGFVLNGKQQYRRELMVDYNYFEMLGLKLVRGRSFSKGFPSDTSRKVKPVVVNETLFKMLGKDAVLGEYNKVINGTIIGVVKNYNFQSLVDQIGPEEHRLAGSYVSSFMFKLKAGQLRPAISAIESEWKKITSNYPFEYTFLDQTIAKMYEDDTRWQNIVQFTCGFAFFIACIGLFGLSGVNAANRVKEISIRKILGASMSDIISSISTKFLSWVGISVLISVPISWWLMNSWLSDFAYRIQLSWWMFLVVGGIAFSIAILTISFQAIKAAVSNPVIHLKSE